jgi:hypothetical protein
MTTDHVSFVELLEAPTAAAARRFVAHLDSCAACQLEVAAAAPQELIALGAAVDSAPGPCPDADALIAFALSRSPDDAPAAAAVAAVRTAVHVAGCAACGARVRAWVEGAERELATRLERLAIPGPGPALAPARSLTARLVSWLVGDLEAYAAASVVTAETDDIVDDPVFKLVRGWRQRLGDQEVEAWLAQRDVGLFVWIIPDAGALPAGLRLELDSIDARPLRPISGADVARVFRLRELCERGTWFEAGPIDRLDLSTGCVLVAPRAPSGTVHLVDAEVAAADEECLAALRLGEEGAWLAFLAALARIRGVPTRPLPAMASFYVLHVLEHRARLVTAALVERLAAIDWLADDVRARLAAGGAS